MKRETKRRKTLRRSWRKASIGINRLRLRSLKNSYRNAGKEAKRRDRQEYHMSTSGGYQRRLSYRYMKDYARSGRHRSTQNSGRLGF